MPLKPVGAISEQPPYRLTVGLAVLNHLSDGLYSSVAAVITEAVANAWDADATRIEINLDVAGDTIVIKDDGFGMDRSALNERFLRIAYRKRANEGSFSPKGRPVMGRKGIGKLSLFSIADTIEVETRMVGREIEALRLDIGQIRDDLQNNAEIDYAPTAIEPRHVWEQPHGTVLRLSRLRKDRLREVAPDSLRRRLARRFSVIGTADFGVSVNGEDVTWKDRGDLALAQYLWIVEGTPEPTGGWPLPKEKRFSLPNRFDAWEGNRVVRGWLATADRPRSLTTPEGNLNSIVVHARGRLVLEDILPAVGRGELFTKYLTGQIESDFLDEDGKDDIVTSDRQRLREEDERVVALRALLSKYLSTLESQWSELRTSDKGENALDQYPRLRDWLERLDPGWKRKAKSLIGRVAGMEFDREDDRKSILRASVLGFERLRLRGEAEELERALAQGPEAILALFSQRDDFEAALYRDIVHNRLSVIGELEKHVAANERERVLQQYLFDHLWLLDPAWERATGSEAMEKKLHLVPEFSDDEEAQEKYGRVDIRYRTVAGKHVIVELKRAGVRTDLYDLGRQGGSYVTALKELIEPAERTRAQIEVIFVVGKEPEAEPERVQHVMQSVAAGSRLITYDTLTTRAQAAYGEFLATSGQADVLEALLEPADKGKAVKVA